MEVKRLASTDSHSHSATTGAPGAPLEIVVIQKADAHRCRMLSSSSELFKQHLGTVHDRVDQTLPNFRPECEHSTDWQIYNIHPSADVGHQLSPSFSCTFPSGLMEHSTSPSPLKVESVVCRISTESAQGFGSQRQMTMREPMDFKRETKDVDTMSELEQSLRNNWFEKKFLLPTIELSSKESFYVWLSLSEAMKGYGINLLVHDKP